MKKHTNISIDGDLAEKAKDRRLNISEITEDALRKRLQIKEVQINGSIGVCEFCGRPMEKATAEQHETGLTWLWPDEKWICHLCLRRKAIR